MRAAIWSVMLVAMMTVMTSESAQANPKYAAIVIDAISGEVLHQSHADERKYPASLTKMMTLYMTFEALDDGTLSMNQKLPVSRHATSMPPSKLGLRPGGSISVRNAMLALVTKSANDVAVVIAEALGGTESGFARKMTDKARSLGMSRTTFRNASGLPNARQKSTARDMAKLAQALLRHYPQYYHYFSTSRFSYNGRTYGNHNNLLKRYDGTDGIKTGYIRASGFNLVASTKRNGRRIIAVVFGGFTARSRDDHMITLLNRTYASLDEGILQVPRVPSRNPFQYAPVVADRTDDRATPERNPTFAGPAEMLTVSYEGNETGSTGGTEVGRNEIGRKTFRAPRETRSPVLAAGEQTAAVDDTSATDAYESRLVALWGVQVGAFTNETPAHEAAAEASETVPHLLADMRKVIDEGMAGDQQVYRAQFTGLTPGNAHQTCQALRAARLPCIVLPPPGS